MFGDRRGFVVLFEQVSEAGDVTLGFVDSLERVAFRSGNPLLGGAFGFRDDPVVFAVGLIDHSLPFLLSAVDFAEGALDWAWRVDVDQLNAFRGNSHVERADNLTQAFEGFDADFGTADGEYLIHGAVADDFADHTFGEVAQCWARVAELEEILIGVGDAVLQDPLDLGGIEVASDHVAFFFRLGANLVRVGHITRAAEAELELQLAVDGNDGGLIDAVGDFEAKAWILDFRKLAESLDDGDGFWADGIERGENSVDQNQDDWYSEK